MFREFHLNNNSDARIMTAEANFIGGPLFSEAPCCQCPVLGPAMLGDVNPGQPHWAGGHSGHARGGRATAPWRVQRPRCWHLPGPPARNVQAPPAGERRCYHRMPEGGQQPFLVQPASQPGVVRPQRLTTVSSDRLLPGVPWATCRPLCGPELSACCSPGP